MTESEKYRERWEDHIGELERLKWNLDQVDHSEVDEIKNRLHEILDVAVENNEEVEEKGMMDAEFKEL